MASASLEATLLRSQCLATKPQIIAITFATTRSSVAPEPPSGDTPNNCSLKSIEALPIKSNYYLNSSYFPSDVKRFRNLSFLYSICSPHLDQRLSRRAGAKKTVSPPSGLRGRRSRAAGEDAEIGFRTVPGDAFRVEGKVVASERIGDGWVGADGRGRPTHEVESRAVAQGSDELFRPSRVAPPPIMASRRHRGDIFPFVGSKSAPRGGLVGDRSAPKAKLA